MDNKGRLIGRARGRASTSRPVPGQEGTSSQQSARSGPGRGDRRPGGPQVEPDKKKQDVDTRSRSHMMSPGAASTSGEGQKAGSHGETTVARGALRGRRQLPPEIIHTRPDNVVSKKGISGRPTMVTANYFRLNTYTNWVLFQYRVDFAPKEENTGTKCILMRDHQKELGGYIFDGSSLFTSHRLQKDPMELFSQRSGDDVPIRITVMLVKQVEQGDSQYLQIFNVLVRKCLRMLRLQLIGRNYFDPSARVQIPEHRLELWPGYVTSIRQHESSVLMCSEITSKVMRTDTLLDLLYEMQGRCPRESIQEEFKNEILGLVVLTDYNNRTYRVDDVDFNKNPQSTFSKGTQEIMYATYYKERYNREIRNRTQPLIVSRSKPRELRAGQAELVYLVPELCRMTGLSDAMRENHVLMRAVADHTRVGPSARVAKLLAFSNRLRETSAVVKEFKDWNLQIADSLVEIKGRVIPAESIIQGLVGNKPVQYDTGNNVDWTAKLRANPMLQTCRTISWAVFVPNMMLRETESFIDLVQKAARGMNMHMGNPEVIRLQDDRPNTYINMLGDYLSANRTLLVVCCVTNNKADRYSAIKKICCVDRPVASQVLTKRAMTNRGAMSIATKVAVQINCKLGGSPWTVLNPIPNVMVVGYDVSHDTMNKRTSYGAMVASLNNSLSRYYCAVCPHENGEELSNQIAVNMIKALQKFRTHNNGSLPSRIIFYRDGVGDGQIKHVFEHEVNMIKVHLQRIYSNADFRFTFIIVSKRINTRFFASGSNPSPGTVVDDVVTLPERYDFFIVSQSVRQGSVSPTSYNVICDNSGLSPDQIQRFTYKMCHLYYNWSGTVKVPAPVQYAHKLAMLVSQNLHRVPHADLEEFLFFL